jgi:hypothetical protein
MEIMLVKVCLEVVKVLKEWTLQGINQNLKIIQKEQMNAQQEQ